jgi:hypothetical protein
MKSGNRLTRAAALLTCILFGTVTASAASILTFTAAAVPSNPFTITGLTFGFTGSEASASGTITCNATTTCSGAALSFVLGVTGLSATTPVSAEIVGDASAAATGSFVETSPGPGAFPFTVGIGHFDQTILSSSLPGVPGGALTIAGTLGFTIGAGQSITLPINFFLGAQPVPEPSSLALLGLGLLGVAVKLRRKTAKS